MAERPNGGFFDSSFSRREFLRKAAAAGVALPPTAAFLAACGKSATGGGGTNVPPSNAFGVGGLPGGPYPLARPDRPVTWNIPPDNQPIADGLKPEAGPLKIFGYGDYIYKKVLNAFQDTYGVKIQYTSFTTPEEMVAKLRTGATDFDILVTVTLDNVGKLIAAKLIQPVNKSYIPNFQANVWPSFQSPFYDRESRYTIPYTLYSTGITWNSNFVTDDVASMANPYDILWDTRYRGKVHILNGARDAISVALLRRGVKDVNTGDTNLLNQAKDDLLEGAQSMNWKFDHTDYNELGQFAAHHTWSGQVAYYQYYLPKGLSIEKFSYAWPPKTPSAKPGLLQNDVFAIPKSAQNPVLAHLLINHVLDAKYAIDNYGYEGYQPPLNFIEPDNIVSKGLVPKNLENIVITEDDFKLGVQTLELPPEANQMWESIYQQVTGGA